MESSTLTLVLQVWRRRKWLAILTFATVFLPAVALVRSLPNIYRATATLLVDRGQVAESFVKAAAVGEETETRLQTIKQEMLSGAVLTSVVQYFKLDTAARTSLSAAVDQLRRDIEIEVRATDPTGGWARGATVAFAVSYRGTDPETVAKVANSLASFHVDRNAKMRELRAKGTAEFLRAQLAEVEPRLEGQERRIGEFKRRYAGELPEQVPVNLATLERLHTELRVNSESQIKAMERRAAVAKELAESGSRLPAVKDPRIAELAKLKQELRELRSRFNDNYPDVVRAKREIAELETALAEDGPAPDAADRPGPTVVRESDALGEFDAQLKALRAEEERMRRQVAVIQARIENAPRREQELQELSRSYTATREHYNSLLKRSDEAQLIGSMEHEKGERFRVLDPAGAPTQPVGPHRLRLIVISMLLAVAASAVVTAVVERSQAVFRTTAELRAFTQVPVLVSIPRTVTPADLVRRRLRFGLGALVALFALGLLVAAAHHFAAGNEQLVRILWRGPS
ncbi:MAG: hypothetical protein DME04_01550 [Candidatus Rokuibacteriota bacterium]|nr:MAG: hypothetical protein DME04_01550 [Candidatus Rokubacteria bacterium]